MVVIDQMGGVLWGNDAAERLFGRPLEELAGTNALDVVHPDDKALADVALVWAKTEEGGPESVRGFLVQDGKDIVFDHVQITPKTGEAIVLDNGSVTWNGQAKSGTTLLRALLDGHPQLLALPQDTDYFSTVLTKLGNADRQAQFDYLTQKSYAKILFGGTQRADKHDYSDFPQARFLEIFRRIAFDPANAGRRRGGDRRGSSTKRRLDRSPDEHRR